MQLDAQWELIRGAMINGTSLRSSPLQASSSKLHIGMNRPPSSARGGRGSEVLLSATHGGLSMMQQGHKTMSHKVQGMASLFFAELDYKWTGLDISQCLW